MLLICVQKTLLSLQGLISLIGAAEKKGKDVMNNIPPNTAVLEGPNLESCLNLTIQAIKILPDGIQKAYVLAHCYSPYVYTDSAEAPGGSSFDGREDGRFFLVQPIFADGRLEWGIWEFVRFEKDGQGDYSGKRAYLLSIPDLWSRLRSEGFLIKWEVFMVELAPGEKGVGNILKINTRLREYGPGPEAQVLIDAILDTKWLAED
jgi:hypothetical protein